MIRKMVEFEEYHWKGTLAVVSTIVFIMVCVEFDKCDSLESLSVFCLIFALVGIAKGVLGYWKKLPFDLTDEIRAMWYGKADLVLGLLQVVLSIWGAALTFPQAGSNEECNAFLYYNAFLSSLIPLCLIFFILLMYGIEKLKGGIDNDDDDNENGAVRNERSESLVDSEIGPSVVADVDDE